MKQTQAAYKGEAARGDVRAKAELAVAQIKKQFGEGAIMRLGETAHLAPVHIIPTGSLSLDVALGVGGVPRGRVIEIFGPEGSGKTTLAQSIIANAQKAGGIAAFIDAEHAFDVVYSRKLGVDVDNLLVSQPDTGEQALDIVEMLVRSGALDVIVIDSVAALVPRAEIEGEMGDSHVGLQARLMSQALRKLAGVVSKTNTCIVFINQIRMKIGVLFGNPETTSGGNALKFYASVRIDIRRIANLKEGENIVGNRTKVKVVKNKVAPPFRIAEFDIIYGEGISYWGDLVDLGVLAGVLEKSGTWITCGEERLGQGRERAKQSLRENPALARTIEEKVRAHFGVPMPAADGTVTLPGAVLDAKPDGAVGGTPEAVRGAGKVEPKADAMAEAKPDAKPEAKADARPETKAEAKPDAKPVAGSAARPEPKELAAVGARDGKPDGKTAPDARPGSKPAGKPGPVRGDARR